MTAAQGPGSPRESTTPAEAPDTTHPTSSAPTASERSDRVGLARLIPDNIADLAAAEGARGAVGGQATGPAEPKPVGDVPVDPAEAPPNREPERALPTVWEQMGGPMGMLDSGLPVLVFIVGNVIGGLGWGIGAAIAAALVIAGLRIARKRPVTQAVAGLFGVGIAAFIAYKTDSAK
ncbi:MAG: DUF3159 domain-containing protein, partial [Nakamurella sp.]